MGGYLRACACVVVEEGGGWGGICEHARV